MEVCDLALFVTQLDGSSARGVDRLSVMPGQTNLSVVTKYNLWEGHTCIHKKMVFCVWHD